MHNPDCAGYGLDIVLALAWTITDDYRIQRREIQKGSGSSPHSHEVLRWDAGLEGIASQLSRKSDVMLHNSGWICDSHSVSQLRMEDCLMNLATFVGNRGGLLWREGCASECHHSRKLTKLSTLSMKEAHNEWRYCSAYQAILAAVLGGH